MSETSVFYHSSNGDHWMLVKDGEPIDFKVRHEPNQSSGGQVTETPLPEFRSRNQATPQGAALEGLLNQIGALDADLKE